MGMWSILEEGRDDYGRRFGMRSEEAEEAYREGCKHGYEKAMREIRERGAMRYGERSREDYDYSGRVETGERRMFPPYLPEVLDGDDMGERRRRRANGRFY